MKKLTKVASVAVVLAMLLMCICGCQSKTSSWPAADDKGLVELKIGGIGPLTGDYAIYGTATENGAKLAAEEINAAGGVNGFKFNVEFQDSQGKNDLAVSAYGKLLDSGMKVSLGGTLSGETASVVAEAKDDGILVLTPTASSKPAIADNDSAFRLCFNDPDQGKASAQYIYDNALASKVAVFYGSDNDYCVGLYNTFKSKCEELGVEIVDVQEFTDSTKTDFSTQIASIKNSGATLVFLPIYSAEASLFLTQAYGVLPSDMLYFGADGISTILDDIDDTTKAENVFMLTPFSADDTSETVQKFVKAYKDKYGSVPSQFAADGYDAVYAIAEVLKTAGVKGDTVASMSTDDFNKTLVETMTKVSVSGVTGNMTWTADGETVKDAKAMLIKNGVASLYTGDKSSPEAEK